MKHVFMVFIALCISTITFGQFQVSVSSGYAIGSAGMKLGEKVSISETENSYGSYGEGSNIQLRGTYFFNNTFGVDVAFGYLHGADKTVSEVQIPTMDVNAIARARADGAAVSLVYKFTNNVYGRFGALIKIAGKTEAVVYQKSTFTQQQADAFGIPLGSYSETNYIEDYHGQFPLGFVAAFGYRYEINEHFSVFAEAEYYGISLKRKDSEITSFNTDVVLPNGTVAVSGLYSLDNLPTGYVKNSTYVDNLPNTNTDASIKLAQKVPYSSFGVNLGISYNFKGSHKEL